MERLMELSEGLETMELFYKETQGHLRTFRSENGVYSLDLDPSIPSSWAKALWSIVQA